MKLFAKFVVGIGILVHQKISERLNEEVDCERQSSPLDERIAQVMEAETSGGRFAQGSSEAAPERSTSTRS
jgi:hypothetical protein